MAQPRSTMLKIIILGSSKYALPPPPSQSPPCPPSSARPHFREQKSRFEKIRVHPSVLWLLFGVPMLCSPAPAPLGATRHSVGKTSLLHQYVNMKFLNTYKVRLPPCRAGRVLRAQASLRPRRRLHPPRTPHRAA